MVLLLPGAALPYDCFLLLCIFLFSNNLKMSSKNNDDNTEMAPIAVNVPELAHDIMNEFSKYVTDKQVKKVCLYILHLYYVITYESYI